MAINISLINNYNSFSLLSQTLGKSSGAAGALSSLLTGSAGSTSLLSSSAKSLQTANLSAVGLISASGQLTSGNPLSVFSGAASQTPAKIEKAVTSFVSSYNKTVSSLGSSSNPISKQGAKSLAALADRNATALAAIGITINDDGKLEVDETALKTAATSDQAGIQSAFNGSSAFAATVAAESRSAVSQSLGLTSGAGFMALYSSSLSSGASNLLASSISRFNAFL